MTNIEGSSKSKKGIVAKPGEFELSNTQKYYAKKEYRIFHCIFVNLTIIPNEFFPAEDTGLIDP